jgi:hypothetical protein
MGPFERRLSAASPSAREAVLRELEDGLRSLPRDAFDWRPEIVYALASG